MSVISRGDGAALGRAFKEQTTMFSRNRGQAALCAVGGIVGLSLVGPIRMAAAQTEPTEKPVPLPAENVASVTPTPFSELGQAIAGPTLQTPAGATIVRQVSAPIGDTGETVLLNVYRSNGDVFTDVLTQKGGQAWTRRNHLRLKSPLPLRPEKMVFTLRYLEPHPRRGFLIVASDDAGNLAMTFPKGFGGTAMQQLFLTNPKPDIRRSYSFNEQDSRGFTIIKATVDTAGQAKTVDDIQYYVWNGQQFIPRKPN
jgi:hypothetical protein